jgi:hypothetical protein
MNKSKAASKWEINMKQETIISLKRQK